MSLHLCKTLKVDSRPISIIRGGELDGTFLCISENMDGDEAIEIPEDSVFTFLPELRDKTAQHVHIVGPSGCGKSTACQEFVDHFPGKSIVVSADEEEDENLSNVDGRIKADDQMHLIDMDNLKDKNGTQIIFDDIEGVPKEISKSLNVFKRGLHERGRKFGICTINVYHRGADGANTRSALGEMTHLVIFPNFANNQNTKYLLEKYAGLPSNFCDLVKGPAWGRRVLIAVNDVPQFVIGEHAAAILNHTTIIALAKHHRAAEAKRIASAME
jgi:hypothetical protein